MNIHQFRGSRRYISDLSTMTTCPEDANIPAYVYADMLYIAIVDNSELGKYWLVLERSETYSDDLPALEQQLLAYGREAMGL